VVDRKRRKKTTSEMGTGYGWLSVGASPRKKKKLRRGWDTLTKCTTSSVTGGTWKTVRELAGENACGAAASWERRESKRGEPGKGEKKEFKRKKKDTPNPKKESRRKGQRACALGFKCYPKGDAADRGKTDSR